MQKAYCVVVVCGLMILTLLFIFMFVSSLAGFYLSADVGRRGFFLLEWSGGSC